MGSSPFIVAGLIDPTGLIGAAFLVVVGSVGAWLVIVRPWRGLRTDKISIIAVTEQVRAVGRFVALEVAAKEIATATSGWTWLPPLLLSPARLAMIFTFEKQYGVDLSGLTQDDVRFAGKGRFRLKLPAIEGRLRLTGITPYDIQSGRVLGLLDVIQMNAERQKELMARAQEQAAGLFAASDERYTADARRSVERQLNAVLALFGVSAEIEWAQPSRSAAKVEAPAPVERALVPATRRVESLPERCKPVAAAVEVAWGLARTAGAAA